MYVEPARLDLLRVGAHDGISSLFTGHSFETILYCYKLKSESYRRLESGKSKLAVGKTRVSSTLTREETTISFGVLHLGDHNLSGGIREFMGDDAFRAMESELCGTFERGDMMAVIQLIAKHFGQHNYSLWHLFKDEQRAILNQILQDTLEGIERSFKEIYEDSYSVMSFIATLNNPIPKPMFVAAEHTVNRELRQLFQTSNPDISRLTSLISQSRRWSFHLDTEGLRLAVSEWLSRQIQLVQLKDDETRRLATAVDTIHAISDLKLDLDVWNLQNMLFTLLRERYPEKRRTAESGDTESQKWIHHFTRLCDQLHVRI